MTRSSNRVAPAPVLALMTFLSVAFLLGWLSEVIGDSVPPLLGLLVINGLVLALACCGVWVWRVYRRRPRS
jgi:hypothetical protein